MKQSPLESTAVSQGGPLRAQKACTIHSSVSQKFRLHWGRWGASQHAPLHCFYQASLLMLWAPEHSPLDWGHLEAACALLGRTLTDKQSPEVMMLEENIPPLESQRREREKKEYFSWEKALICSLVSLLHWTEKEKLTSGKFMILNFGKKSCFH